VNEFADLQKTCRDCSNQFVFTASEQKFFADMGYTAPVRCKSCRDQRKTANKSAPVVQQETPVASVRKQRPRNEDYDELDFKRPKRQRLTRRQRQEQEADDWDF
jgi:Probable zinc-ribbon domain